MDESNCTVICPIGFNVNNRTCFGRYTKMVLVVCIDFSAIDINECESNNETCSDICKNTNGSYECSCYFGFVLDTENNCKGKCLM